MFIKDVTTDRSPAGTLSPGLAAGLAGGFAEIAVVWAYSSLTGGDAGDIAHNVGTAAGIDGASVTTGLAVHMGLAVALGLGLSAALSLLTRASDSRMAIFSLMTGCLAAVWAINFFAVLPIVSPGFVHLLPYAVTLTSKLAFGLAAASVFCVLPRRAAAPTVREPLFNADINFATPSDMAK